MSYQVLARKWRPRSFAELVGQRHVVQPLINALDNDRLHHAFLFTGTRGVGKTTIARILAKSLNCEQGVTSTPCGKCTACQEVDEGRFIDLLEVDAASRTKVDDTRELLENVQYAPARGRYKVYLIDEVHMLSGHSFNALLKTLEEPPPHAKFLLATTEPQKLPVTVLSRCLQFSLKRLSLDEIAAQLKRICEAEEIACEADAIPLLARAADGSMRDGLSLLDQAISFGGGSVKEGDVRTMLGTIDQRAVDRALQSLAGGDARGLLATVDDVIRHGGDVAALLDALIGDLHQIALIQHDPALSPEAARLASHAQALAPEDVQLYYQCGILGRRDLPLAPEPRVGVEMALLRMLAFRPAAAPAREAQARARPPDAPPPELPRPRPAAGTAWREVVEGLAISGILREIVNNAVGAPEGEDGFRLTVHESCARLLSKDREAALKEAFERFYGRKLKFTVEVGRPETETPSEERARVQDERQQEAVRTIMNDPTVRTIQEQFNARVNTGSIRPKT